MTRRADVDRADATAAVRGLRQAGNAWCDTCGERIPPDEPAPPSAAEPRCAACRMAMGSDLQSYVSHYTKSRPHP